MKETAMIPSPSRSTSPRTAAGPRIENITLCVVDQDSSGTHASPPFHDSSPEDKVSIHSDNVRRRAFEILAACPSCCSMRSDDLNLIHLCVYLMYQTSIKQGVLV